MLDFSRTWLPYIYLYGVGGGIFLIGIYIILKSKSLKMERKRHKLWFHILIFGILYYMGLHGLATFAAIGNTKFASLLALTMGALIVNLIYTLTNKPKGVN